MILVVHADLHVYDDDRFALIISYGESQATIKPVNALSKDIAANACLFMRKCSPFGSDNGKYIFYDWKKKRFSEKLNLTKDDNKMFAEIRGSGKDEFICSLILLNMGARNKEFILNNSDIKITVDGDKLWLKKWQRFANPE